MEITAEPGIEIRRIVLLTRLRDNAKGMTMTQLVRDCSRVAGWSIAGHSLRDGVRFVLQTLIDDKLVATRARFVITSKGQEYLEDPLKWHVEVETREHVEENVFWKNILAVFDRAYSKLRTTTKNLTSSVSQQRGEPETTDSS